MPNSRTAFAARPFGAVTLADLKQGDAVVIAPRQACLIHGLATVEADSEGDLFVDCRRGMHYLELFLGDGGVLVGVSRPDAQL